MALGPEASPLESGEAFLGSFVASGVGPSASSHGSPVPLPSDLSFRSPTPAACPWCSCGPPMPMKLVNCGTRGPGSACRGFSHLPSGLYPSYLHLNHLEPPSSGSPLLSQLGQPSIFDSQKDGFYLPAPGAAGALHSQAPSSRTPGGHSSGAPAKGSSREGPAKERGGRGAEPPPLFSKKDPRAREEAAARGVVDLTQEAREGRQDRGHPRLAERLSPFLAEPGPPRAAADSKGKNPPPPPALSLCNGAADAGLPALMAEARGAKDAARQDESARLRRTEALLPGPCPCPSPLPPLPPGKGPPAPPAASAGAFASQPGPGVYTIFPSAAGREPGREHRVVAPTFVPSVEAFDERPGPIQIASQARDARAREREAGRPGVLQAPPGSPRPPPDRPEGLREKNSVIRSLKRPPPAEAPPVRARASPDPRVYLPAKELLKPEAEPRPCERTARGPAAAQQAAKLFGLEPARPPPAGPEHKWKPFELGNFAATQMAVLAAQHHHASRAEEEAAAKKAYLDPGGALPRAAATCARPGAELHPAAHGPGEASAMQSLIKYSGSFAREAGAARPGGCGKKSPFGGLGTMKPEPAPASTGAPRSQARLPHPGGPAPAGGRQLKRDPERPESAKAFGREGSGAQGEAEVRHPPVGIAVAVARQKDSGSSGRLGTGLADQERSLSLSNVKGEGPEASPGVWSGLGGSWTLRGTKCRCELHPGAPDDSARAQRTPAVSLRNGSLPHRDAVYVEHQHALPAAGKEHSLRLHSGGPGATGTGGRAPNGAALPALPAASRNDGSGCALSHGARQEVGETEDGRHGRADEDCGDERARHREERLLGARLDRDQEKLLRESKELADLARLHPTGCAANGLNPNLMVTGGPALAGSGRWSADPTAHLATHPWLPRSGSTSMWLAGHPYGLAPPSLHQGMAPAFPPGLGGSLPSAYQFVRDPQSGQLVVVPSDHLPHLAELMERAAVPPLWPALYPPGRSSLHHAQQLQLFSQQHFLRQQELLYLQQQAAQALELQRSAQLVQERLKAQEHRAEMEEKVSKRSLEAAGKASLAAAGPGLLPRKPPGLATGPAGTYGKAMSPPPSPRASPVAALKAKVIQKLEDVTKPPPTYAYPATPSSHPSSPPPASPPPTPGIARKEEAPENVVEKKDLELEKDAASPFQALFSDVPPRYPFPALPPHYGRPYPFLLQPTAAADADGLAPDVPLPADGPERLALSPEDKPIRLSPSEIPEPLREGPDAEPLAEREVKAEVEDVDEGPAELPSLESPLALRPEEAMATPSPEGGCGGGLLDAQALGAGGQGGAEPSGCLDFAEGADAPVDSPGRTASCTAVPDLGGG
ncbi:hypothetical protein QTO34_016387 [Cnephaeus nilssonii]|uniref:Trinucleotide repeat containing 18 n=1 Tax=Cnephaeus nilssonii TaxID=3371016 RepID=A0AA40LTR7_CNENI|nr:hypothetical protein QTO34_016387 [Eptesicus nilssonii]